ncbi:hypothetical protein C8R43DRAFT_1077120 [Mycena crocata]|nr:hypothetical protein C8R43DRAFT_1077120 [Mycena crocata]
MSALRHRLLGCTKPLHHSGREYSELKVRHPRTHAHVLSTFNPSLLKSTDLLDISERTHIRFCLPSFVGPGDHTSLQYFAHFRFPHGSKGFLYYHSEPHWTALEGGIRFRVAPEGNPASFASGKDLLLPSGFTWQVILPQLACRTDYLLTGQQLLREGLVTEEQLSRCRALFAGKRISPQYTLFRIDSPFIVNFASKLSLTVVASSVHQIQLSVMFAAYVNHKRFHPWTGSALACFEISRLPEHAGRRVLHLRFLKMFEPVTCAVTHSTGRIVEPREGELFSVRFRGNAAEPWAWDIDNRDEPCSIALRELWDSSRNLQSGMSDVVNDGATGHPQRS